MTTKHLSIIGLSLTLAACAVQPSPQTGSGSVSSSVSSSSAAVTGTNTTGLPLTLPEGWSAEKFADVPGARMIVHDTLGGYWVSQPSKGSVTLLEVRDGVKTGEYEIFRNLRNPHGLAIDPENGLDLYIAEEDKILKARLYSDAPVVTISTLPTGGRHTTRTLGFGPDGRLYVSIGSTCDVCVEKDDLISTIISMNKDGSDQKTIATGLRNSVFFTWRPGTQELWATDMGRDNLGDAIPPEEVNIIREGDYGWPFCYGDNTRDSEFQPKETFDCSKSIAPHIKLPAHVAPLGLTFIPSGFEHAGDLLVAEHGSWNSSVKVGYQIVRIPLSSSGTQDGERVPYIGGFLQNGTVLGRPVDVLFSEGSLYVTDDKAGAVYRLFPTR